MQLAMLQLQQQLVQTLRLLLLVQSQQQQRVSRQVLLLLVRPLLLSMPSLTSWWRSWPTMGPALR
jgi:hypothetical protein